METIEPSFACPPAASLCYESSTAHGFWTVPCSIASHSSAVRRGGASLHRPQPHPANDGAPGIDEPPVERKAPPCRRTVGKHARLGRYNRAVVGIGHHDEGHRGQHE